MATHGQRYFFVALLILLASFSLPVGYAQSPLPSSTLPLRIIVVASEPEAQQVLQRLEKGENFADVAKDKSIHPSADHGGDVGEIDPNTLSAPLQAALRGLEPGQHSGIIKLTSGFAILQVAPANIASESTPKTSQGMLTVAGRGSIRNPTDVSGAVDSDIAFRKMPKPPGWERDPRMICEIRKQSLSQAVEWLQQISQSVGPSPEWKPADKVQAFYALANLQAYQGKMDEAIAQWKIAYQAATTDVPGMTLQLEEALGIAYFHKSEMENHAYDKPGDRCIFPPKRATAYSVSTDSEKAIHYLVQYLEQKPDDLEVKWLLNLAYMTMGKYPAGVPHKFLISSSAFESKESIGRFTDVAPAAGLNSFSMAGGVVVDDFDNDGLLDVITSS
jgi:hypothetical protein